MVPSAEAGSLLDDSPGATRFIPVASTLFPESVI
jgi:hypothetical protein